MKNLFFALSVVTLLFACGDATEALRAPIEELSTKWDATTQQVTSLMESIGNEKGKLSGLMSKVTMSDDQMSSVSDEMKGRYEKAAATLTAANQQLDGMKAEVDAFVSNWSAKSSELDSLKEGLANGELSKDAQATIDELSAMVTTGSENVASWNTTLEGVSNTIHQVGEAVENMESTEE